MDLKSKLNVKGKLDEVVSKVTNTPTQPDDPNAEKKIATYKNLEYKGGHPELTKDGNCVLTVTNKAVYIKVGSRKAMIPVEQLQSVQLETQDQIEKRVTVGRVLALGVFALAFKKKKKTTDKFLTIDFVDEVDMKNVILMEGKDAPKAHASVYSVIVQYKKLQQVQ